VAGRVQRWVPEWVPSPRDPVDAIVELLRGRGYRHPLDDQIPPVLRPWLVPLPWSREQLWALDIRARFEPVSSLRWVLELPWWRAGSTEWFRVAPGLVLRDPASLPEHVDRMESADLTEPIHAIRRRGRWVVLDGVHRLAQAVRSGRTSMAVKELRASDLARIVEPVSCPGAPPRA
jgi:hypothetical protein